MLGRLRTHLVLSKCLPVVEGLPPLCKSDVDIACPPTWYEINQERIPAGKFWEVRGSGCRQKHGVLGKQDLG
jgi:hypothetical protein